LAFPNDLLNQAQHLATREKKKPKQASLRRAVSTAYYALFHLLVAEATGIVKTPMLRAQVRRAYSHGDMKSVCKSWSSGNPNNLPLHQRSLVKLPLDQPLAAIATGFVALQEARHTADYDLSTPFTKVETLRFVERAKTAFRDWNTIKATANAKVFLAALPLEKQWKPR
jgi:uncharacterized protein (UPF0332 family)